MFRKLFQRLAVLAAVLILTACAGPGRRMTIPLTMPQGEVATIVAHNQTVPDWMLDRDKLALNYIVKGDVSAKQLAAASEAERACRIYTGTVRPNNLVTVFSQGVLYGLAGYLGVGLGAKLAFSGAQFTDYGTYGGVAGAFGGSVNGVVTSGGQTYTFENCGREVLMLFPGYDVRVLHKSPY